MDKTIEKIKYIAENSKPNNELLIRTNTSIRSTTKNGEWFVHYTYDFKDDKSSIGVSTSTVFKVFTDNLDDVLDKIIEIIQNGDREKINEESVY